MRHWYLVLFIFYCLNWVQNWTTCLYSPILQLLPYVAPHKDTLGSTVVLMAIKVAGSFPGPFCIFRLCLPRVDSDSLHWLPLKHQRHSGWLPFPNCLGGCFTLLAQQDTGVQTRHLSRLQPDLWAPRAERKTDGCNSFILHTVVLWLKLSCFRLLPLTDMRDI